MVESGSIASIPFFVRGPTYFIDIMPPVPT
jgi:hypothetical protein